MFPASRGGRGMRRIHFWGMVLFPIHVLPCSSVHTPSAHALRGCALGVAKITVCKCVFMAALVFQRLFFWPMLCHFFCHTVSLFPSVKELSPAATTHQGALKYFRTREGKKKAFFILNLNFGGSSIC